MLSDDTHVSIDVGGERVRGAPEFGLDGDGTLEAVSNDHDDIIARRGVPQRPALS